MERSHKLYLPAIMVLLLFASILGNRLPVNGQNPEGTATRPFLLISDEELRGRNVDWREESLRAAIRTCYPGWAGYSQQITFGGMTVTYDLARIVHHAGWTHESSPYISVNPWVILSVLILRYGGTPPPGFDAWQAAYGINEDIKFAYAEAVENPRRWQNRFANAGSFVMHNLLGGDAGRLEEWQALYRRLAPVISPLQVGTPTSTPTVVVPPPFLQRPYATPTGTPAFYKVNSLLDHRYPIYGAESGDDRENFYRFDGRVVAAPTPVNREECITGLGCYTGHDGMDVGMPLGVPILAAADGRVVYRFDPCGQVLLEHERDGSKIYSEYLHLHTIAVTNTETVSAGQQIGTAGNRTDNVNCGSGGYHLHFGVRLYFDETFSGEPREDPARHTDIDPFGWWGNYPDPWEEGAYDTYGGYRSRWLWWGDEAGDGHYTVDDTESQAQLFHGGAWWTYEVESEEESTNRAIWGTYIETPGTYVIQAYWPESEEATHLAWYRIYTERDGWIASAWVDQAAHGGEWYTLGTYDLPEGPVAVILTDWGDGALERARIQMTEASSPLRVYFDAVRWATPTPQATPTPTPTFTPPPTPTPTRTPTPAPTPTPTPRWGWWEAAEEAALQERSLQERVAYSRLLSRVRDEVMAPDPKGEAYIRLVYRYAPEVTALLHRDPALRREVAGLLDEVRPLLEEMLARRERSRLRVSAEWVKGVQGVLERIEAQASPELRGEIRWWRGWLPRFVGKTGWEVWQMLPVRSAEEWPAGESPEELVLQGLSRTDALAYGRLLSRVRDEVMLKERGGEVYVALVYRYTPEVVGILLGDEALRKEAEALLVEVRPGLESLVGKGGEWRFSAAWLERVEELLGKLAEKGSPELRAEAEWWRERVRGWNGKTPQEVWRELLRESWVREALEPR